MYKQNTNRPIDDKGQADGCQSREGGRDRNKIKMLK